MNDEVDFSTFLSACTEIYKSERNQVLACFLVVLCCLKRSFTTSKFATELTAGLMFMVNIPGSSSTDTWFSGAILLGKNKQNIFKNSLTSFHNFSEEGPVFYWNVNYWLTFCPLKDKHTVSAALLFSPPTPWGQQW